MRRQWSRSEKIEVISLFIAVVGCFAAIVVVPEFRKIVGLDKAQQLIPARQDSLYSQKEPLATIDEFPGQKENVREPVSNLTSGVQGPNMESSRRGEQSPPGAKEANPIEATQPTLQSTEINDIRDNNKKSSFLTETDSLRQIKKIRDDEIARIRLKIEMYGIKGYLPYRGYGTSEYEYLKKLEKIIDEQQKKGKTSQ